MHVLITCKSKKYWNNFLKNYRAATSLVSRKIWPKFKLIQALIHVLITSKYLKFGSKATKNQWRHHFHHYKSMGGIFRLSRADNSIVVGPIWPKFKLLDIIHVLDIYKIRIDRIKSNLEKLATSIFRRSGAGNSVVRGRAGRISNSSNLSCMSSLPASMKWIRSKTAEKRWQHRFSHYKSMGVSSYAQEQLTPHSVVKSRRISNSSHECMLPANMKMIG